jgi:hypothetical protein
MPVYNPPDAQAGSNLSSVDWNLRFTGIVPAIDQIVDTQFVDGQIDNDKLVTLSSRCYLYCVTNGVGNPWRIVVAPCGGSLITAWRVQDNGLFGNVAVQNERTNAVRTALAVGATPNGFTTGPMPVRRGDVLYVTHTLGVVLVGLGFSARHVGE